LHTVMWIREDEPVQMIEDVCKEEIWRGPQGALLPSFSIWCVLYTSFPFSFALLSPYVVSSHC
jgi:hypothetical protein